MIPLAFRRFFAVLVASLTNAVPSDEDMEHEHEARARLTAFQDRLRENRERLQDARRINKPELS